MIGLYSPEPRTVPPLYLVIAASVARSIVNTVLLGHRATAPLAAFALWSALVVANLCQSVSWAAPLARNSVAA
jgi:hypothetical protein